MADFFIFRNCFTGAIAGGDVHSGGVAQWIHDNDSRSEVYLIRPYNDGQDAYYPEAKKLKNIQYRAVSFGSFFALTFIARALLATLLVRIPETKKKAVLIASSHFLPDVLPISLRWRTRKNEDRVVYIHHIVQDMDRPANLNTKLANLQEQVCFFLIRRFFDKIIVVNHKVANDLKNRGFTKQKILISSNFVSETPRPVTYERKKHTIVYCGRMVPQKGVYDFLDICEQLHREATKEFSAVMVGIGPESEKIKNIIAKRHLPITMTGYVTDVEKFNYLSNSKLFVFPSREEGWGIAIAESLTAGTPVAAYNLDVYKEVFGDAVHTSPINQPDLLTELATDLLKTYDQDSRNYDEEQSAIINQAKNFSLDRVAQEQVAFFKGKR